jgi:hypothetical protein
MRRLRLIVTVVLMLNGCDETPNRPDNWRELRDITRRLTPPWREYCALPNDSPMKPSQLVIVSILYRHACGHEIDFDLAGNRCSDRWLECRSINPPRPAAK